MVPPFTGHINPTLSLGAALIRQGHRVGWIGLDASLQERLPQGGELWLVQHHKSDREKQAHEAYLDAISRKIVYGVESVKFLYEDVLIPLNRYMFRGISSILNTFPPDVVINDHQLFAGAMAAWQAGIPSATSVTAPAALTVMEELPRVHEWGLNKIFALQKELGIREDRPLDCSDLLTLVFTSREFFGKTALPEHYRFVGPVLQDRRPVHSFDWEAFRRMGDRPGILISIGTTFDHEHKKDFFRKVIDAFGDEPLTVVVVSDPALFDEWPRNFLVQPSVPQLELLPCLDAVVCHAGHNTVCETLSQGLPLVVIPIAYDQSFVAGRVAASGSGIRLNFRRFKARHLNEAVREVLHNPAYKAAAGRLRASFESAGGVERAAGLLEETANVNV